MTKEKRFNKTAYQNEFISKSYDRINLTVPKGQKEAIKEHAKKRDQGSVNAFIQRAIKETMERETAREAPGPSTGDEKPAGGCTPVPRILYK